MISRKKETQLYNAVHEEVMGARISIARLMNAGATSDQIDNVLSDLSITAPQKAIDIFKREMCLCGKKTSSRCLDHCIKLQSKI